MPPPSLWPLFSQSSAPLDISIVFTALTARANSQYRLTMAIRSTFLAWFILTLFFLSGETLLRLFGISLTALRSAG